MRTKITVAMLALVAVAGCVTGPINPPPCVSDPRSAATVTVQRGQSIVGAPATMFLVLRDERLYALLLGQSYSFQIDPGTYRIGYDLGFNKCRQGVTFKPAHRYLIEMWPACNVDVKDIDETCPTR